MNAKRRKERGSKVRLRHPMYFPEEKSPWPSARAVPQNKMVLQKGWNWGFWPQTMPVKQQNGPPTSSYHTTTNPSPSNHVISTVEKFRAALIYATIAAQAPNVDGRALERFQAPKPAVLLGLNKEQLSSARPGSCLHVAAASPAVARGALTELEGWPVHPLPVPQLWPCPFSSPAPTSCERPWAIWILCVPRTGQVSATATSPGIAPTIPSTGVRDGMGGCGGRRRCDLPLSRGAWSRVSQLCNHILF